MPSHAYVFGHLVLLQAVFTEPGRFFAILNGPDAERYLSDLWSFAGKNADEDSLQPEVLPTCNISGTGNGIIAIVRMPTPREMTEPWMVAVVAKLQHPDRPVMEDFAWVRVFALEHSIDITTERPMTVIGEWTQEETHVNHGAGPLPEEQAFVAAIFELLRREKTPQA
jgi:hypothetical protein